MQLPLTCSHPSPLQLDYTGVAMQIGSNLWAGVIVTPSTASSRRLGWVLAADLGYCTGACSLTGEFCSAQGSPCCSNRCARISGYLVTNPPDGSNPVPYMVGADCIAVVKQLL